MATTLHDQYALSIDVTFQQRVEDAVMAAIVAIHGEVYTTLTPQRDAYGKTVEGNMAALLPMLALAVAVDPTVAGLAGSPQAQANVTDVAISNAVSAAWNSFAVRD